MYERTARLDLDNINNDTKDGLHITSMSGSWLAIVHGFAGLITTHYKLEISPQLPKKWNSYSFKLHYLNHLLNFEINKKDIIVSKQDNKLLYIWIYNKRYNMVESLRVKTYVQK
jgi:maltose phosphorylase